MKIDRSNPKFYKIMGPVFGSRMIQRETNDRFYDDPDKEWYIEQSGDNIDYVISVKNGVIKNVYIGNGKKGIALLKEIYPDVISGIVPACYSNIYSNAGYMVLSNTQNFVSIKGGYNGQN